MQPSKAISITPDTKDAEKRLTNCLRQMQSAIENYQQARIHSSPTVQIQSGTAETASKTSSAWDKALQTPLKNAQENLYQLETLLNQKRFLKNSEPRPVGFVSADQLDFEVDFISIKDGNEKDEYDQLQLCQAFEHQMKFAEAAQAYKDLAIILSKKSKEGLALQAIKKSYDIGKPSNFSIEHHLLFGELLSKQGYAKLKQNHYISAYTHFKEAITHLKKAPENNASLLSKVNLEMVKLKIKHDLIREAFQESLSQIHINYFGFFENVEAILYYPEDQKSTTWVEELFEKDLNLTGFNVKRSNNHPRSFDPQNPSSDPNTCSKRFDILVMSPELANNFYDPTYSDSLVHQLRIEYRSFQKQNSHENHPGKLFDYAILIAKDAEIPWPNFLKKVKEVEDFTKEDKYYEKFFTLVKTMISNSLKLDLTKLNEMQAKFNEQYQEILSVEITDDKALEQKKLDEEEAKAAAEADTANVVTQFFQNLMKS